jgi:thiamine pyrophosphate-dependent acetolactate synthase large subunit-like protein
MLDQLVAGEIAPSSFREQELKSKPASYVPLDGFTECSTDVTIDMRTAMIRLDQLLPEDRVVVSDVGRFIGAVWRYLHVPDPTRFTHSAHFSSLGLATSTAIGAAVARPDLLTVGIAGDGGAMMGLIEFSTAVREEIPFLLVVLNDGSYGAEYSKFVAHGVDPSSSLINWPEFADVAKALGGDGVTVRTLDELEAAANMAKKLTRPLLIDIKADPKINVRDW